MMRKKLEILENANKAIAAKLSKEYGMEVCSEQLLELMIEVLIDIRNELSGVNDLEKDI